MGRKIIVISSGEPLDFQVKIAHLLEPQFKLHQYSISDIRKKCLSSSPLLVLVFLSDTNNCVNNIRKVRTVFCRTPIICFCQNMEQPIVIEAFRAGASDILIEDFSEQDFIDSVNRVCPAKMIHHFSRLLLTDMPCIPKRKVTRLKKTAINNNDNNAPRATLTDTEQQSGKKPQLLIHFLGRLRVYVDDNEILHWKGKKSRQLLAFIAYYKKPVFREVLMDQFWPASSPASARNCLNVTLHQIRSSLQEFCGEEDFIIFKDECYFINPNFDIQTDVSQLKSHWKKGRDFEAHGEIEKSLREYEKAAALYKDDFLIEFQYDAWCDLERENLKETNILILNKLSHYFSMDGKPRSAIELCNQILQEDRCREDIHRRLMRSYYRIGQKDRALRQYQKCVEYLKEDLDAEPSQMTIKLYKKIRGN